jgi:hypothetical protein
MKKNNKKVSTNLKKQAFRREHLVSDSDLDNIRSRLSNIDSPSIYAEAFFNAVFDKMYEEAIKSYSEKEED